MEIQYGNRLFYVNKFFVVSLYFLSIYHLHNSLSLQVVQRRLLRRWQRFCKASGHGLRKLRLPFKFEGS